MLAFTRRGVALAAGQLRRSSRSSSHLVLAGRTASSAELKLAAAAATQQQSCSHQQQQQPQQQRFFSSNNDDSTPGYVHVSIDEAQSVTTRALQKIGWDADDAALQAEIMVAAELCGNNQGLVKMYQPALMAPSPDYGGKPVVERRTANTAVVDARQSPGMLAAATAVDCAVQMLQSDPNLGAAVVCAHSSSTSSGQLAYYADRAARRGYACLILGNSPEFVAAAPGGRAVLGTNPLAVGIPLKDSPYPFTFDMATSSIALFGVLSAKAKGEPLPDRVAYDQHGNWTTDAAAVLEGGAIATFGGHKGMGLALTIELLAGALSGAAVLGQVESKKAAKSWGHTAIVIRPESFTDDFPAKAASVIAAVRASGEAVRIPGERSARTAAARREAGVMPIPEKIWESIVRTARDGLPDQ